MTGTSEEEPAEHLRFWAYMSSLEQVAEADEAALVGDVLADQDQAMAQSAVLLHLDRRAAELCGGSGYEQWAAVMGPLAAGRPLLALRLTEWSLLRAIAMREPVQADALIEASNWLQLRAAATPDPEVRAILAEHGRTRRIRHTARAHSKKPGSR
ncbi:hypothetical protein [Streptomyces sp. NPDC050738]|uniref:hypothetical protein n=1 Tax=Streptomyces sp. NPDC050738 TaxID=3154744 RepID=UPI00343D77D4